MLSKPKGLVENYKPKKHSHKCPKCGKEWACSLQIDPSQRQEWERSRKEPYNVEKMKLACWWDNDPDCVKCS
jgi:hypothetical protein